ncbi:hypothetical protein ACHAXT_009911 [Thalassiosira profunda]
MDGSYRSHAPHGKSALPGPGSSGHAASSYADDEYANYSDAMAEAERSDILKLVLYDLNSAIAPRDIRLMAIHAALEEFDHDDEPLHDEELELRADHILLQKLTYALCVDPRGVEVGYILAAMEAVYRAGRSRLAQSFHEICDALLPLFVEMLRPPAGWHPTLVSAAGKGEVSAVANEAVVGEVNDDRSSSKHGDYYPEETSGHHPTSYGDYDEESAESVEIPSQPASEFFDNMARGSAANSSSRASQPCDGTVSPVTECVDDSLRGASTIASDLRRSIPKGTDAYLAEMRRRTSDPSESDVPLGGRPQGAHLEATEGNALVPQPPVPLEEGNDRALVPHPAPTGQWQDPSTGGNERIRMDLQAATEALHGQTSSGPLLQGHPLAIEGGIAEEDEEAMSLRGGGEEDDEEEEEEGTVGVDQLTTFRNMVLGEARGNPFSDTHDDQDNPFSDDSSFKGHIGISGGYDKIDSETHGEDEHDNPFLDHSSFRGSSTHSETSGMMSNDHMRRRQTIESESTGATPRQFNTSINRRPPEAPETPASDSEQRGAAGFDEQGGFSGTAPQVFAGFEDEDDEQGRRESFVNSESKCSGSGSGGSSTRDPVEETGGLKDSFFHNANGEGKFDQSERSGHSDRSGRSYQSGPSYRTGHSYPYSEYTGDPSAYSPGRSSGHVGTQYTEASGYADNPNARRQSELTDEWDESMRSGLEEGLPPAPRSHEHELQFRDEAKYDGGSHGHHGSVDEDIFQFNEPRLPKTSTDYCSYSDPVDGEVCDLAVRKILKILRYFSRVLSAMEPLAQQAGLVDALLYHMTRKPRSVDYEEEIAGRVDAIAVVVNLACAEENKIIMVYHPGLLDAVINIANNDPIDEARELAAIVLMNLAYSEEVKVHMVNQRHLLDTLVNLLSDASPFTRRYASAALFTLACTYANTAVMARHCDGGILEALRKVLLNDPIDEARVNAAEALFNLARNNSETAEHMGNHPRLLASLAHSVLTDYSADVRAYAARALEWLSADIHHPMVCHRVLLKALTVASQWTKTTCISEALKIQASLSENRAAMARQPGLLDALATLALMDGITDDEVKTCAISAIERLSKEPLARPILVKHEGVMTALTKATFAKDGGEDDLDDGKPSSMLMRQALKNLAEEL